MKTYSTEADTATTVQTTCTGYRTPLKLLQVFQFSQNSTMSAKTSVSSPLKTVTNKQKKGELSSRFKESQVKNSSSNTTSRQTTTSKNSLNSRNSSKTLTSNKKEGHSDCKSKVSESSDGSLTSVGSLTSSPKWSHIKNKFENGGSSVTKTSKTPSLINESKKSVQPNKASKNTSTFENSSYIHRNKYLSSRKDNEKKIDLTVKKSENSQNSVIRSTVDKSKLSSLSVKIETAKEKAKFRSASPKNSHLNIPVANASSLHSNVSSKNASIGINSGLKNCQVKSVTSTENSVKGSRSSSPSTVSSSSPTPKSYQSKPSQSNIAHENSVNNSKKEKCNDCSNDAIKGTQPHSSKTSSNLFSSKSILDDSKMNSSFRGKQKFDDKPVISFNQVPSSGDKIEAKFINKTGKKNVTSDDRKGNNIASLCKASNNPKTKQISAFSNQNDKAHIAETVEKIEDLTRNSQNSKTIWVKDTAGNWIKKNDTETKIVSNSKVASLRNKFIESNREGNIPLTKSSTTSSVPSKHLIQNSRPLAKSSTTSSICDKVFLDDLSKKITPNKQDGDTKDLPSNIVSKNSNLIMNDKKQPQVDKDDNALKLSIVQRAVLSYEGNLALLSPESQRRLKLVTEKVQAQTDDDKILKAKSKMNPVTNSKNYSEKKSDINSVKQPNNILKTVNNAQKSFGEPVLPVRNFLNRYQQINKTLVAKEQNKPTIVEDKGKANIKESDSRSVFYTNDFSSAESKKKSSDSVLRSKSENVNGDLKNELNSSINNSRTKLTVNLNLPNGKLDLKSKNQENDYVLQPNSSFLWRRSEATPSEMSKSSTASSVSLTSSDYRNYYDIGNYYSSLELEIEKRSENSEEHIYIDSQESNSSENNYASPISSAYQNISSTRKQNGSHDEWTDISDDDYRKNSVSSNQSSTLKRRKNKRHSSHRDSSQSSTKSQNEQRKQCLNDTISFTDSSDTLINDEIGNESVFDMSDIGHVYEPVYESLGNYLKNQDEENDENCSISLSPDEPENVDFMHCSLTSLESAGSVQDKEQNRKSENMDEKNISNKKSSNKISQLKRHLSWTKNDIRLELSSKFNKIKIKKNGRNSTEIGLKMQENENANTSPKKKTFIKCILRQKSAGSIPLKRSPSPKKESAMFYVHLTMGREKKRPFSDSVVSSEISKVTDENLQNSQKRSDSSLAVTSTVKRNPQFTRPRKFTSGHAIQRPKTPPPLPPVQTNLINKTVETDSSDKCSSTVSSICDVEDSDLQFYSVLDADYISNVGKKHSAQYENEVLKLIHCDSKSRTFNSTSVESTDESDAHSVASHKTDSRKLSADMNLPLSQNFQTELLKSPFEEEPMYQFYQKDVQQRATLWYSVDGSESEFEDDIASKVSDPDYQSLKRPVLQSQMSAMDLVHGEGGQRTLWCEVPEVVESGILKTISPNERKIQEAMFEVITSEASYLKSLNFLIEHFVQCAEFSGDYTEKHILDKRERHVLFSDIQPVRDVSVSLLADLEKRWLENIVLGNICDILYHHASRYFCVYVKYCSNQLYQERLLRELKEKRPEFVAVLKRLESNPICQGLDMHSFLMLPMQRITRMPLLIDAIFHRLSIDTSIYESCKIALATLNKLVAECNEGACKMQRMEEMLVISQQIDFKACKGLGLLSASRWLVKKGELVQLIMDNSSRRAFGRSSRWCKVQLYLFLFTDLLVVTRKKSDDSYSVVDYCPRNMLQVLTVDENTPPLPMRLPSSYRNVFQLIMLNNRDGKTVEMLLSCLLESDRTRWMNAVRPAKSENPDEKIYEEWDCPQVQCTHAYNAQQPDELSLEEADVVNVFKKMSDGWFEGERIRDGIRGWFPSSHTVEIINSHVRARNLHQRYRLLMLSQTYLEEQYKAQALQTKK